MSSLHLHVGLQLGIKKPQLATCLLLFQPQVHLQVGLQLGVEGMQPASSSRPPFSHVEASLHNLSLSLDEAGRVLLPLVAGLLVDSVHAARMACCPPGDVLAVAHTVTLEAPGYAASGAEMLRALSGQVTGSVLRRNCGPADSLKP